MFVVGNNAARVVFVVAERVFVALFVRLVVVAVVRPVAARDTFGDTVRALVVRAVAVLFWTRPRTVCWVVVRETTFPVRALRSVVAR